MFRIGTCLVLLSPDHRLDREKSLRLLPETAASDNRRDIGYTHSDLTKDVTSCHVSRISEWK